MPADHGRQAAPPKGWFVDPLIITYILCAFLTLYVFKVRQCARIPTKRVKFRRFTQHAAADATLPAI